MTILPHTVLFSSFPLHTKYWRRAVQVSLCVAGWSPGLVWSAPAGWRAGAREETSLVGHSARANPPLSAAFPPPPRLLRVGLDTSAPQQPYLIARYSGSYPLRGRYPVARELLPHAVVTRRELPPHGKDISRGYWVVNDNNLRNDISMVNRTLWPLGVTH